MQCPKCRADCPPFATREGVEMNFCRGCKGPWFDRGELALYAEGEDDPKALAALVAGGRATAYACPCCAGQALVEVAYPGGVAADGRGPLLVDVCGACHGVFLDARELALVEAAEARRAPLTVRLKRAAAWLREKGYVKVG